MVGSNHCPLDEVKDVNRFVKEKLKEYGIEFKDNEDLKTIYCIKVCPNLNC